MGPMLIVVIVAFIFIQAEVAVGSGIEPQFDGIRFG